jgi:hypothetical protein
LNAEGQEDSMDAFLSVLPSLLWFVVAVIALILFRRAIIQLVDMLVWRLRMGSAIKVASLEIGQAIPPDEKFASGANIFYSNVRPDGDGVRFKQRESYYIPNRNLQLVHRVAPSKNPKYAYDVLIYLIPHWNTDATLASVKQVEYYCGKKGWQNAIFTITDRAHSFQIALSTHGAFVCTAEIQFTDGETVTIGRYIDGEMTGVPPMVTGK